MSFETILWRYPGRGGWTFARLPVHEAPTWAGAVGRVPIVATVDGQTWHTSVWRDAQHGWLLPVPRHIRRAKGHGDLVVVSLHDRDASGG